jgi:hypothetical protein
MTRRGDLQKLVRRARKAGAHIEQGRNHTKVFDDDGLVAVLPHGDGGFGGPNDRKRYEKAWRERGW